MILDKCKLNDEFMTKNKGIAIVTDVGWKDPNSTVVLSVGDVRFSSRRYTREGKLCNTFDTADQYSLAFKISKETHPEYYL